MELEAVILERVRNYQSLPGWERSELGRALRRLGLSYGEIMELIPVKKSTVATWCREVLLFEEQVDALRLRRPSTKRGIPRDTQRKRRREIELIRAQATLEAEHLIDDPLWAAGVALYWGEGTKTSRRLELANCDVDALRLFMAWTTRYHDPAATFSAVINIHADNDEVAARHFWSRQLGIDLNDFTKSFVQPDGTGHRKNHLSAGVCRVRMRRSTDAFTTTMAWIDFLKKTWGH